MAVNKNFVVKNGLEVKSNLLVADTATNSVGIGTSVISGQPYMLLTSYESKNSIESQGKIISSIALYIPPNGLRTAFDADMED